MNKKSCSYCDNTGHIGQAPCSYCLKGAFENAKNLKPDDKIRLIVALMASDYECFGDAGDELLETYDDDVVKILGLRELIEELQS